MRVAITGASGLVGSALGRSLERDGHDVVRLVRRAPAAAGEVRWDPAAGTIDAAGLGGVEAVVHLAGEGIGEKRWTAAQKQRILDSRVRGTTLIARTIAALEPAPRVLVSASGINVYGTTREEPLTEESAPGDGFMADVCRQWEASTAPAADAGVRVVNLRSGIVLSPKGGAFGRMAPLLKLGLGGRLGSGRQWWSWVALDDEIGLIRHAIDDDRVSGPFNATSPNPATNAEIVKTAARILHRPAVLPVPKFALDLVVGRELVAELVLGSLRVMPALAQATGYRYVHPDVESALRAVFGREERVA